MNLNLIIKIGLNDYYKFSLIEAENSILIFTIDNSLLTIKHFTNIQLNLINTNSAAMLHLNNECCK